MLIEPLKAGMLLIPTFDALPKDPLISEEAKKLVPWPPRSVELPPSLEDEPCTIACCWFWNFFCDCLRRDIICSSVPFLRISFRDSLTALITPSLGSESEGILPPSIEILFAESLFLSVRGGYGLCLFWKISTLDGEIIIFDLFFSW